MRTLVPALVVRYRARFKVALCGESRPERSTLDVVLPVDPWLAYWHVPAARRRLMRFFDDTAVTNPCSDDDFADLPHPIYYWYDWLPDRHGLDGAGQPFDCREWLKEGADYFTRPLSLERLAAPIGRFDEQAWASLGDVPGGPRATVLLGVLDHAWPDLALASLRREIGESGRDPAARARTALRQSKPRERASQKLLRLLADLAEVMVVHRYETRVDAGYLEVALHGKLRHSHWPFHLRVFLGLTDIFGPAAPSHWGILRRALAEDDIVIYAGHSGIGENVRLAQIEEHLQLPHGAFVDQYRRRRRQIVAFLSCYSYMYFGQDLVRAFGDNDAFAREFIYTGSGFTSGDRGALSVIDVVDRVLERGDVQTMRFLAPEDFLLWESLSR